MPEHVVTLLNDIVSDLNFFGYTTYYQVNSIKQFIQAGEYTDAINLIIDAVNTNNTLLGSQIEEELTPVKNNATLISKKKATLIYFTINNLLEHSVPL